MARTLVVGDIHGSHLALEQVLERSKFDRKEDTLVSLGDLCDGWPFVKETIELLQTVPNLQVIIGNHDEWSINWARTGQMERIWTGQGGEATLKSFEYDRTKFPLDWFQQWGFIAESEKQIFVHGGIDPNQKDIQKQKMSYCLWDRSLIQNAQLKHFQKPNFKYGGWKDIFVGHTTTQLFNTLDPVHFCNVWGLDTGAGWDGKLTIMDADSKKYWQSDLVTDLYPNIKGRK